MQGEASTKRPCRFSEGAHCLRGISEGVKGGKALPTVRPSVGARVKVQQWVQRRQQG